jgi:hypothetical protein
VVSGTVPPHADNHRQIRLITADRRRPGEAQ